MLREEGTQAGPCTLAKKLTPGVWLLARRCLPAELAHCNGSFLSLRLEGCFLPAKVPCKPCPGSSLRTCTPSATSSLGGSKHQAVPLWSDFQTYFFIKITKVHRTGLQAIHYMLMCKENVVFFNVL